MQKERKGNEERPSRKLGRSRLESVPSTFQGKVKEGHGTLRLVSSMKITKLQLDFKETHTFHSHITVLQSTWFNSGDG